MNEHRKKAKKFFEKATKSEWYDTISEAFLSRRQEQVALLKRMDFELPTWKIANLLNVSDTTITRDLAEIYDRIAKIRML